MESMLDVRAALKQVDLFASLNDELLNAVAASSVVENFEAGELLVRQGAEADGAWVILEGEVRLLRN